MNVTDLRHMDSKAESKEVNLTQTSRGMGGKRNNERGANFARFRFPFANTHVDWTDVGQGCVACLYNP